jgi:hypothetical protein
MGFGIPKLLDVLVAREIEDALWILLDVAQGRCRDMFLRFIRLDCWSNMVNDTRLRNSLAQKRADRTGP